MKKKLFLIPLFVAATLMTMSWGCDRTKTEDDFCEAFPLVAKFDCPDATLCCPVDMGGGDCYIVNPEGGENFYCDITKATSSDPEGCDEAIQKYIDTYCGDITKEQEAEVSQELRLHIQKLMTKARHYSVCN